jgi:hypothetical protein
MRNAEISLPEHVELLRNELAQYHNHPAFRNCTTMGDILAMQLKVMLGV